MEWPWIVLETAGVEGLEAMLAGPKRSAGDWPYAVGWIDCLAPCPESCQFDDPKPRGLISATRTPNPVA